MVSLALASDFAVVGRRVRRELDHPHGVAVAQRRLLQDTEGRRGDIRPAAPRDSAGGLHGPASVEPRRHALAGVYREDEGGPGDDAAGDAERTIADSGQPYQLVPLHGCRRRLRCVHHQPRGWSGHQLPDRVPVRGCHGVHGLLARAVADVDLVSTWVDAHDQIDNRRRDLRMLDRRHLRLAVAQVGGVEQLR